MNHEGRCYQTNGTLVTLSPGEAEEHQAAEAGKLLLDGTDGEYLDDDEGVFGKEQIG